MENKQLFLTGTFDVIHKGHIALLEHAKSYGGTLTVAIDTDRRVAEKKGPDRPFHNENDRKYVISSIKHVDNVVLFNSDEQLIFGLLVVIGVAKNSLVKNMPRL